MSLRLRLSIEWLLIGIAGSLLVIFALRSGATDSFDNLFYDQLSSVERPRADDRILLVNIDQKSLDALGKWPWKRSLHGDLIAQLQKANPRSITLDIILSENGDADDDAALSAALAQKGSPVYLPLSFDTPGDNGRAYNIIQPVKEFAASANGIGHVNIHFDSDGKVRRAALCFDPETDGKSWPHLMEQVYRGGAKSPSPAYDSAPCGQALLIPYAQRGSHSEISYVDILEGTIPADLITGRDIIVGATASGMGDNYPVPYADGALLAGSEIMANMLTAIRNDNFTRQLGSGSNFLLSLTPLWLLMIGFLIWLPRTALIASLALLATIILGSIAALSWGLWLPPGAALLGIIIIYPLWGWRRLQAMSNFMDKELSTLEKEDANIPLKVPLVQAGDLVGRQSAALAGAIDHMRDLRKFLRNSLSDLPDPMVATDLNDIITLASDRSTQSIGYSIVGKRLEFIFQSMLAEENQGPMFEFLSKTKKAIMAGGEERKEAERAFIRFQNVEMKSYVMRLSAIETASGELQGYIYYLTDITDLANAQEEREHVLQLLSHDMRAPQSAIIAALDGDLDRAARERIENNARRTMRLAQDFVDMARMGESEFAGEELLIVDLIRDVTDNFWSLAKEREIQFEIEDASDLAFISGEFDSLVRAFSNLIDNAIKYGALGGTIRISAKRIEGESGDTIQIDVANNGKGIDLELLPRLFQRFVSSNESDGRVKGTGLGLSYVHAVIKRHGGTISAANTSPNGCCFTIRLPIAPEE